jgi:hypothetical protein
MRLEALEVSLGLCEDEAAARQETFLVSPTHEMNSQSMLEIIRQDSYLPRVDHIYCRRFLFLLRELLQDIPRGYWRPFVGAAACWKHLAYHNAKCPRRHCLW